MALSDNLPGYARVTAKGVRGLVVESSRQGLETILEAGTLYDYASKQSSARKFTGRVPAYAITLPQGGADVVVRHSVRGGVLGRTRTDLFLPPTRGLRELINALRLRIAGIPTPEVVAFVTYRAGPVFRRSDVATAEIKDGHDLSVVLREMPAGAERDACLDAAGRLVRSLNAVGAHHPDLNARNILVTWDADHGAKAHILDVDRIRFHTPADPMVVQANIDRLERSLKKLRAAGSVSVSDDEIATLRTTAGRAQK
jgi:tRNA A-37 threonylcarbamoyl transferase component Bud32